MVDASGYLLQGFDREVLSSWPRPMARRDSGPMHKYEGDNQMFIFSSLF